MAKFEPHNLNILEDIVINDTIEKYADATLITGRGDIFCRYYKAEESSAAVIFVGGVGGGWDSPAKNMYPLLCEKLKAEGISSLRLQYRFPTILEEGLFDVVAGIEFLEKQKIRNIGLVGHSLGGAVVIQAAAVTGSVNTVITLSTQCYGADAVAQFRDGCSILLLHGENDKILPYQCSEQTYKIAKNPKQLILYVESSHNLDESNKEVLSDTYKWIVSELSGQKAA